MKTIYKLTMIPVAAAALLLGPALPAGSAAVTGGGAAVGRGAVAGGAGVVSGSVVVRDVRIPVPGQAPVSAYVVRPAHRVKAAAGVLYLHWFEPPAATQNRTEFLPEAIDVAARGGVAVLPDLTFPWHADPVGTRADRVAVETQLAAVTRAYRYLLAQPGVAPRRTAVVGHDYGAMYAALLAQREKTVRAAVLMAPDATWANWFDTYWLDLPANQKAAYRALFAGLDPVENVSRLGASLYLQFATDDQFVPPATRAAFTTAAPRARVSLYDTDHSFDSVAPVDENDRLTFLETHLGR